MRFIKNDKGYSMLLTIFVFLLFTILSISLLSVTLAGANRNSISEDNIQSTELARMGIDSAIESIHSEIEAELLNKSGINAEIISVTRETFEKVLDDKLKEYTGKTIKSTDLKTGNFTVTIGDDIHTDPNNPLKKSLKITSKGIVDGTEKIITSTVEFGQTEFDTLNYAIGTNISDKCRNNSNNCDNGEGNVFLHGGVQIKGDMKVEGDLFTSRNAYYYIGRERWQTTLKPSILPIENGPKPRLFLGGNIYNNDNINSGYSSHIKTKKGKFNNRYLVNKNNIQNAFNFGEAPIYSSILANQKNDINIENTISSIKSILEEKETEYVYESSNKYYFHKNYEHMNNDKKIVPVSGYNVEKECKKYSWLFPWICDELEYEYKPIINSDHVHSFTGDSKFKYFYTDGGLTISNRGSSSIKKSNLTKFNIEGDIKNPNNKEAAAYIGGKLTIGNESESSYDINRYDNIEVSGLFYVDDDLHIRGANAKFNAIMFVNGDVTIEYSQIRGLNYGSGKKGSLLIFATGDVNIRNNSVNSDIENPSDIKGYFYSEKDMEIFGVGSNMHINGGIAAKSVVLNAVRGNSNASNHYFPDATNSSKPSRLQINYDSDLIETFNDLIIMQPIINHIDPPRVIERGWK